MRFAPCWNKVDKKIYSGAQPEIFQGRGGFMELGLLEKLFGDSTHKDGHN